MWIFLHWIPDLINVAPSWSVRPASSQIHTYSVITKSRQGFDHVSCTQTTCGLTLNLLSGYAPCYHSLTSVNYLNNVTHEAFNEISALSPGNDPPSDFIAADLNPKQHICNKSQKGSPAQNQHIRGKHGSTGKSCWLLNNLRQLVSFTSETFFCPLLRWFFWAWMKYSHSQNSFVCSLPQFQHLQVTAIRTFSRSCSHLT